jgi:hypothetical protein
VTGRKIVAGAQRLLVGVVLVLSGGYMLVYLFRWEWNRAIISGIFFVATEVALASSMILRRLRSLEQRGPATPEPAAAAAVFAQLRSVDVERPNPFRWLTATSGSLPVLVPVLLGAGAVLSAIAYVVERVAEATALPAFDRRVAQQLAVMAPPPGGLLGGPTGPLPVASAATSAARPRRGGAIRVMVAITTIGVLTWIGVDALVEGAQARPDPADRPVKTTIDLVISHRGAGPPPTASANALWIACRPTLGALPVTADVVARGDTDVSLLLRPGLGRLGVRRLTGCLDDVRLDLVRANVIRTVSIPYSSEES